MNRLPSDLNCFDFCWSAGVCEHLGSIRRGKIYIERMLGALKPGGVSVHTLAFNLLSDAATPDHQSTVLYRKRDIDSIAARVRALGHRIDLVYQPGDDPADLVVDLSSDPHGPSLKTSVLNFTTTSIGLIITKAA